MRTARIFLASIVGSGAVIAATVVTPLGAAQAQAASLPLQGEAAAFVNSTFLWNFNAPPPGANQPSRPSAAHPYPVILTEGTFASMENRFGPSPPIW